MSYINVQGLVGVGRMDDHGMSVLMEKLASQAQAASQAQSAQVPANPLAPQSIEEYRGWVINFDRYGSPGSPFVATKKGTSTWPAFGLQSSTEVNRVSASSVEEVKKLVDGAISGTYIPPEVLRARKVAHNNTIAFAAQQAFQAAIPVSTDKVSFRGNSSATEAYKGWVIKEHWYGLRNEVPTSINGLGFSIDQIVATTEPGSRQPSSNIPLSARAPRHYIFVAVNDSDTTKTLVATTKDGLKAKIDAIMPPQVPANAPVAANTSMSTGKKLAVAGGLAAAAFLMMNQ